MILFVFITAPSLYIINIWTFYNNFLCILSVIFGILSFLFCILFMPESLQYLYNIKEFQKTRSIMEGLLGMNGFGYCRLLFRFKTENIDIFNKVIYN